MKVIDDPIIGPLELLDSSGLWQRSFELPGFLTAALHFESEVSVAPDDAGHLMQWSVPNRSQQLAFLRLQENSVEFSQKCAEALHVHAASVTEYSSLASNQSRPLTGLVPDIVFGYDEDLVSIHFQVPWDREHGCTLLFDGLVLCRVE